MTEEFNNPEKKKCEKCNNPWFPKPEGYEFSQYCFAVEEKKKEVSYDQESNPKKFFCVNCIPLVEKNFRDKERFRIFRCKCQNAYAAPILQGKMNSELWVLRDLKVLYWEKEGNGWYDSQGIGAVGTKYNFYDIYQGKKCQVCQESLDEEKEKECCQKSQEIISQQKSEEDNSKAERERTKIQVARVIGPGLLEVEQH